MSQGIATPKDLALRAIGRTVVNFQRLEHNLKVLARLGPVEGALSKVQRDIDKRAAEVSSFTLGQAIGAWLAVINNDTPPTDRTPDLLEPTLQVTVSLETDAETLKTHAVALKALLEIRNNLVHGRFAQLDWDSSEACEALVKELNRVNEAIAPQMDFLAAVGRAKQNIGPEVCEVEDSHGPANWLSSQK
jgi:hypothetical protein